MSWQHPCNTDSCPGPILGRDAHPTGGGGITVEGESHSEKSGTDKPHNGDAKLTLDIRSHVFSNSASYSESTPVSNQKECQPLVKDQTISNSELMVEQEKIVSTARQSMTDNEHDLYNWQVNYTCQDHQGENKFWGRKFSSQTNCSSSDDGIPEGDQGDTPDTSRVNLMNKEQLYSLKKQRPSADRAEAPGDPVEEEPTSEPPSQEEIKQYPHDKR